MKYLNVKGVGFASDRKLNLDLYQCDKFIWESRIEEEFISMNGDWIDCEIDISNIPPSLFFMAVNNTYSSGFSCFVPLDITFLDFSKATALYIESIFNKGKNYGGWKIPYICEELVDLKYLNETGKIKSARQWNFHAKKNGHILVVENENGGLSTTGTIQEIVTNCLAYLEI